MATAACSYGFCHRHLKTIALLIAFSLFAPVIWLARNGRQLQLVFQVSDFQVVERSSAFVYSAYIDDRPARDFTMKTGVAAIRIFAYFHREIDVRHTWKCILWCEDRGAPVIVPIATVTDLNGLAKLRFMVAMVVCALPENLTVHTVSLVSFASNETNFVGVVDLRRVLNDFASKSLVSFTVCTSPMHGDHYTVSDIVNFIEANRIFGAERFVFYVDAATDQTIRHCLESYRDAGLVEIYAFTPPVIDGLHYHGQILTISDCVYRTMYRTRYLINADIDEIIVPVKVNDWQTMLDDIHRRAGATAAERFASYSFQNQFYPLEAPDDEMASQLTLVKLYNIKSLQKTMKELDPFPHGQRSKIMARPERVLIWHVHTMLRENIIRQRDQIYHVPKKDAVLHHYRAWPSRQTLIRDLRMFRNASLLIERVHFGIGHCFQ